MIIWNVMLRKIKPKYCYFNCILKANLRIKWKAPLKLCFAHSVPQNFVRKERKCIHN